MSVLTPRRRWIRPCVAAAVLALGNAGLWAANLKIEAKLIWATDESKSPDATHVPVDAATTERLRKTFKWKHYYVVKKVVKDIPSRGAERFELSKKCTVEIKELEGPKVEVKLIGEGKPIHKTVKSLNKGESFIYSGDDKNETAWFVMISDLPDVPAK